MKRQQFCVEVWITTPSTALLDETDIRGMVDDALRVGLHEDLRHDTPVVEAWDEVDEPSLSVADRNPGMESEQ